MIWLASAEEAKGKRLQALYRESLQTHQQWQFWEANDLNRKELTADVQTAHGKNREDRPPDVSTMSSTQGMEQWEQAGCYDCERSLTTGSPVSGGCLWVGCV